MRSKTLGFLYFIKYLELICLTVLTAYIMISGFTLIQDLPTFAVIIKEKYLLAKRSKSFSLFLFNSNPFLTFYWPPLFIFFPLKTDAELSDKEVVLIDESNKDFTVLQILIGLSMVMVLFTLLHNNLLTNIRFYSKMRCVTCGLCTYDACNYAICHCFLHKVCRD